MRSVKPMNTSIGETLTIRGRYFKPGRNKNSVAFKRDGGRAIFVKAEVGTRKLLRVKVSSRLNDYLLVQNGNRSRPASAFACSPSASASASRARACRR